MLGTLYFAPLTAAGVQLWGEETTGSLKGDSRSTDSEGERACRRCPRVVTNSRRKTQTRERDRWLDARESALWPAIAPLALAVPSRATLVAWPWRASAYSSTGRSKIHRLEVPHKKRLERERERERDARDLFEIRADCDSLRTCARVLRRSLQDASDASIYRDPEYYSEKVSWLFRFRTSRKTCANRARLKARTTGARAERAGTARRWRSTRASSQRSVCRPSGGGPRSTPRRTPVPGQRPKERFAIFR